MSLELLTDADLALLDTALAAVQIATARAQQRGGSAWHSQVLDGDGIKTRRTRQPGPTIAPAYLIAIDEPQIVTTPAAQLQPTRRWELTAPDAADGTPAPLTVGMHLHNIADPTLAIEILSIDQQPGYRLAAVALTAPPA